MDGDISLGPSLTLNDVPFFLNSALIYSVSSLTKEPNFMGTFFTDHFAIQDAFKKKMIGRGERHDGGIMVYIFFTKLLLMPLGYHAQGKSTKGPKLVCKLNKSIYGLKQASRQWYSKFSNALLKFSFTQSKIDYSLFMKGTGSDFNSLLIYVDDIILASPNPFALEAIKQFLYTHFKLEDLGCQMFPWVGDS